MRAILCLSFSICFAFQAEAQLFWPGDGNGETVVYSAHQGRFGGEYISYYKNGKEKSKGTFKHNARVGVWTVWDSTGAIVMQRDYKNSFEYERIVPAYPKDNTIQLLKGSRYNLAYNKDGYIETYYLAERDVAWHKRIWRIIESNGNESLFKNDLLINTIIEFQKDTANKVYAEEQFKTVSSTKVPDLSTIEVVGFKIKEDAFFDTDRFLFENRITGLCPVVVDKQTNDTTDLFWIWFPSFRKQMASVKVDYLDVAPQINTLDDLFFFRGFYGRIIKESNSQNRMIKDYCSGKKAKEEALRIEMRLKEKEHDLWITYGKQLE